MVDTLLLAARKAPAGARAIRALSVASLELHAELARELDTGFERRGVLNVYATEESYAAGRAEARSSGLSFDALDREEALALEPALGERTLGAVYYPQEARRSAAVRASWVGRPRRNAPTSAHAWRCDACAAKAIV